jgi:hypothetical protein
VKENSWNLEAITLLIFQVFVNLILTETSFYYLAVFRGTENFFSADVF